MLAFTITCLIMGFILMTENSNVNSQSELARTSRQFWYCIGMTMFVFGVTNTLVMLITYLVKTWG